MIPVPSGHAIVPVDHIIKGLEQAYKQGYSKGVVVGGTVMLAGVLVGRRIRRRAIEKAHSTLRDLGGKR